MAESSVTPLSHSSRRTLDCGGRRVDLSRPQVMAVLNITPDSFSDGGQLLAAGKPNLDAIWRHAEKALAEGAAILDVGGESTRPGAVAVSEQEELDRVLPVVTGLRERFDAVISVDTSTPRVMWAAARAGVGMINDVRALERDGAVATAHATGLPICLMHMQGEPVTMQDKPRYEDVVEDVCYYLHERANICMDAGIDHQRLLLDPGFGFGKSTQHNLVLLNRLPALVKLGFPVLVGLSRKSLIGNVLGRELDERLPGSLALATLAVVRGAAIIRAHDVQATVDAVRLAAAVINEAD